MSALPLPSGTPENDIRHIKLMALYIKSAGPADGPTPALTFHIENTEGGIPGHELRSGETPEGVIAGFVEGSMPVTRNPTPLDFPISKKCYIVLKLEGDFWEFDARDGVTTKEDLGGQYYRLIPHSQGGRIAAVSFCARTPFPDRPAEDDRVRHSINLHINFLDRDANGNIRRLPVIIDPDVENRGG